MATVNFSVPEEVKVAFNATFRKEKKSAIIAALMREAVDRAQRKDRARQAATRILERRESAPIVSMTECREARCPALLLSREGTNSARLWGLGHFYG